MTKDSLTKSIDPAKAAILVVDVQNDYYTPRGAVSAGHDRRLLDSTVGPQVRLLEEAKEAGVLVVFIHATVMPGHVDESPARLHRKVRSLSTYAIPDLDWVMEGTWGHQVIDELKQVAPDATQVFKSRNNGFVNTNLDLVLRSNGIDTVVFTGMATDGCVAATARGAEEHGYQCLVARDCVGSLKPDLHEYALKVLASRMEVLDSEEILRRLEKPRVARGARHVVAQVVGVAPKT